ncbi:MAG: hypothetical protein K2M91_06055 [Lachnospiraceae bacterium]|nr:hypothetical protein [Lachnospiraceae bacterium]
MEFTDFTKLVRDEVLRCIGDGYQVKLKNVRKNNGVVLTGLVIVQDESLISPTVYLENYYEAYASGTATLTDIVVNVVNTYNRNKVSQYVNVRYLLNYENVKKRIVYKLINAEKNKGLLEDVPHKDFLDLSIVFQCLVSLEEIGEEALILINNTHSGIWNVSVEELYQAAMENTHRLCPYEIKDITDVLCEIMVEENPEEFSCNDFMAQFSESIPLYALSNKSRVNGAACMLYPNLIQDFADIAGSSLYIIPSSIHELLLLPSKYAERSNEIKDMIKMVNDTQVKTEEVLSYSLYFYDREKRRDCYRITDYKSGYIRQLK